MCTACEGIFKFQVIEVSAHHTVGRGPHAILELRTDVAEAIESRGILLAQQGVEFHEEMRPEFDRGARSAIAGFGACRDEYTLGAHTHAPQLQAEPARQSSGSFHISRNAGRFDLACKLDNHCGSQHACPAS